MVTARDCAACDDFDVVVRAVHLGRSSLSETESTRARVLVERLRLEHERLAHAPPSSPSASTLPTLELPAVALDAEPDPFPSREAPTAPGRASKSAEKEEVCGCGCARSFHYLPHTERSISGLFREGACANCFSCSRFHLPASTTEPAPPSKPPE